MMFLFSAICCIHTYVNICIYVKILQLFIILYHDTVYEHKMAQYVMSHGFVVTLGYSTCHNFHYLPLTMGIGGTILSDKNIWMLRAFLCSTNLSWP